MTDLHKIAATYNVSVDYLRQEIARGVDWSTAIEPGYLFRRQSEIDMQTAEWESHKNRSQREAAARNAKNGF